MVPKLQDNFGVTFNYPSVIESLKLRLASWNLNKYYAFRFDDWVYPLLII